ncbi:FMN reductase [Enteractinococcus coprophilus]|uniref:FMN reductase n=1 Tax=Enteractinococcus coprophilus TaxID=1027633 RepID=A0A543AK07_9MICC|nr:FMN reductase [Enteractinococcus coprophilus]TQL72912.1 FMN reductase [Enteractinococcus coprophilus]
MKTAFESTDPFTPDARHIAIIAAGLSDPSSTSLLAKQLGQTTADALSARGHRPELHHFELRTVATDIADSMVTFSRSEQLSEMINEVEQADGIIAVSPVFKASYSGLFKSFWDLVDNEALKDVPVQLGATGGSPRHSLVIDTAMRPLFSYLRMRVMPTGVYAATEDWGSVDTTKNPRDHESNAAYLDRRIAHAGQDFAEVVARLDPRPRRAPLQPKELEVIPFDQLLNGPDAS